MWLFFAGGDIPVRVGDARIATPIALRVWALSADPTEAVPVGVIRDGSELTVAVAVSGTPGEPTWSRPLSREIGFAVAAIGQGDLEGARRAFSDALWFDADCAEALWGLGLIAERQRGWDEVLGKYRAALGLRRSARLRDARLPLACVRALLALDNPRGALREVEQAGSAVTASAEVGHLIGLS